MGAQANGITRLSSRLLLMKHEVVEMLTRTTDTLERAALERVQQPLTEALVALDVDAHKDLVCPVCGLFCGNDLTQLTECTWCDGRWCSSTCESAFHQTPGRCEHAPSPQPQGYDGEPEPDIEF